MSVLSNAYFQPIAGIGEIRFPPLEKLLSKTRFSPPADWPVPERQGPFGLVFRLVAQEEDRYAQCVRFCALSALHDRL